MLLSGVFDHTPFNFTNDFVDGFAVKRTLFFSLVVSMLWLGRSN